MTIFIILLIYKFIKGTFEYEKVTRFELIIIPVYSAIMMVLSLENVRSLTAAGLTIIPYLNIMTGSRQRVILWSLLSCSSVLPYFLASLMIFLAY